MNSEESLKRYEINLADDDALQARITFPALPEKMTSFANFCRESVPAKGMDACIIQATPVHACPHYRCTNHLQVDYLLRKDLGFF